MTSSFHRRVIEKAGLVAPEAVERTATAVLHALRDRLTPEEADQLAAQLPTEVKSLWWAGKRLRRASAKMRRAEFLERVRRDAGLRSIREARWVTLAVFGALKEQISPGEAEDVLAQLPKDLKEVWEEAF